MFFAGFYSNHVPRAALSSATERPWERGWFLQFKKKPAARMLLVCVNKVVLILKYVVKPLLTIDSEIQTMQNHSDSEITFDTQTKITMRQKVCLLLFHNSVCQQAQVKLCKNVT